jgi:four helix bundle protein
MNKLPYAESFRDLVVYKKARQLSLEIFQITKTFPKEEMFSLTDQIRRSSRAIGAQIAEAWAKRRYEKHFASKLTDADAEQQETQHWLATAADCGYLAQNQMTANQLSVILTTDH